MVRNIFMKRCLKKGLNSWARMLSKSVLSWAQQKGIYASVGNEASYFVDEVSRVVSQLFQNSLCEYTVKL